uniref:Putative secreted peptide n=1 Tax=Anopheles braziliensis TaxID=58242 RepID=A0A2M3ZV98_9DIPT
MNRVNRWRLMSGCIRMIFSLTLTLTPPFTLAIMGGPGTSITFLKSSCHRIWPRWMKTMSSRPSIHTAS